MFSAFDVANYFITQMNAEDDAIISNMKLQKLLYYVQGFHLAIFDSPLFEEAIEAWAHGPVCPPVYRTYKSYGRSHISEPKDGNPDGFSNSQKELLEEVCEVFGQFDASKLRHMSHSDPPWINHEKSASEIPHDEMKDFFKTRIN
ncbi:MAG: SocA family protein [Symploca sp. SIO2E6]|nr:SocA family protein [Symploca sp. SIO2E6]